MRPSPFPGMDPYLERYWPDVQSRLVERATYTLNRALPDELAAIADARVAAELEPNAERRPEDSEPRTERFIHIVQLGLECGIDNTVTVIEFVSPANKRPPGLDQFCEMRARLVAAGVNFVEIDLVRAGDWKALLRTHRCPPENVSTYRACVRVHGKPGDVGYYSIPLRERLPSIGIPLWPEDPQVHLELQPLVDSAYLTGRYSSRLDYRQPLEIPFDPEDAAWVEKRLRSRRR